MDFNANANNMKVTLDQNSTLGNPTNVTAGQSGVIEIVQDATGGRTLSFGANWEFEAGAAPTISAGANDVDLLFYYAESATRIMANLLTDFA